MSGLIADVSIATAVSNGGASPNPTPIKDIALSVVPLANVAALRGYTGSALAVHTLGYSVQGFGAARYYVNASDTTSADNSASIFVDPKGRRWRIHPADLDNFSVDMAGADPTGTNDSTAAIALARTIVKQPYCPGSYIIDASAKLEGLWGPGVLNYAGCEIPIPPTRRVATLYRTIQAKLAKVSKPTGMFALVDDSTGEHYLASSLFNHFFSKLSKALTYNTGMTSSPSCEITNFSDSFYGCTITGGLTFGSKGPIGKSHIFAAGSTLSLTGYYNYMMIAFIAQPGGGTISLTRNGTVIATISTASSGTAEEFSYPNATGGTAVNDVYELSFTGGPVELTGVLPFAQATSPADGYLFFCRHALSSQSTQLFSKPALMQSTVARASVLSGSGPGNLGVILIGLGINNSSGGGVAGGSQSGVGPNPTELVGTTPAVYGQQLGSMVNFYLGAGFDVVLLGLMQPTNATSYPNQTASFGQYAAMQKQVADQYGIDLISLDAYDLGGNGDLADGLHPGDAGQEIVTDIILEHMASPTFNLGRAKRNAQISFESGLYWVNNFNLPPSNNIAAISAGTLESTYSIDGNVCKFHFSGYGLTPLSNSNSGELCVLLPLPGAGIAGLNGNCKFGTMEGVSSPATGASFWTGQVVPAPFVQGVPSQSFGYVVIRSGSVANGGYGDAVLSAGCDIAFDLEYYIC